MRVSAITHRRDPLYLTMVTGRLPDEPSVIGEVFNALSLPVIRAQIPELRDLWLPPAGCSYRIAVVQIDKRYPGQARRVMMALRGMLPQFGYTRLVIVVDTDIDPRNRDDIAWALSTRMDPGRDLMVLERTPMDCLDFASPPEGLAGKLGVDATTRIGSETTRDWGQIMAPTRMACHTCDLEPGQAADPPVPVGKRMGGVEPVVRRDNGDDPSARRARRDLKTLVEMIHEGRNPTRGGEQMASDGDFAVALLPQPCASTSSCARHRRNSCHETRA